MHFDALSSSHDKFVCGYPVIAANYHECLTKKEEGLLGTSSTVLWQISFSFLLLHHHSIFSFPARGSDKHGTGWWRHYAFPFTCCGGEARRRRRRKGINIDKLWRRRKETGQFLRKVSTTLPFSQSRPSDGPAPPRQKNFQCCSLSLPPSPQTVFGGAKCRSDKRKRRGTRETRKEQRGYLLSTVEGHQYTKSRLQQSVAFWNYGRLKLHYVTTDLDFASTLKQLLPPSPWLRGH